MDTTAKIKVALVRGSSLNEWEGKMWENIAPNIETTGVCSPHNSFSTANLSYPVVQLPCSGDSRLCSAWLFYAQGVVQKMFGLEKVLQDFHIAHTAEIHYFLTNQAVRAKKHNPKLKVVTTVWDNSFGRFEYNYWPGFKYPPAYWRQKIATLIKENSAGVDLFLPVSESSRAMLLSYGVDERKIKILTPTVSSTDASSESLGSITGLSHTQFENKSIYLTVCRLVKEKGVYDLVYAWQAFSRNAASKNAVWLLIGNGPEKSNLQRMVHELGLESSVIMVDQVPNAKVKLLYTYVTAFILGSLPTAVWQEQFGYVLAEAIAAECPVVATTSGAIPEVVQTAGLLVPAGNPMALAQALVEVTKPEVQQLLKKECRRVRTMFAPEQSKSQLVEVYESLV